jgi:hypothetical protein
LPWISHQKMQKLVLSRVSTRYLRTVPRLFPEGEDDMWLADPPILLLLCCPLDKTYFDAQKEQAWPLASRLE